MDSRNSPESPDANGKQVPNRVDLTTTLYGELRRLAVSMMQRQYNPQTLQATALLHEAWLRLGGHEQDRWDSRAHYFSAVAEAMRHILVDRARRRQRKRHGGGLQRVDIDLWNWERIQPSTAAVNDRAVLAVSEALKTLAQNDAETADIVKLHYFVGLSVVEIADLMEISRRTVERRLAYARFWMGQEIQELLSA